MMRHQNHTVFQEQVLGSFETGRSYRYSLMTMNPFRRAQQFRVLHARVADDGHKMLHSILTAIKNGKIDCLNTIQLK
jgi:hypothetical protein